MVRTRRRPFSDIFYRCSSISFYLEVPYKKLSYDLYYIIAQICSLDNLLSTCVFNLVNWPPWWTNTRTHGGACFKITSQCREKRTTFWNRGSYERSQKSELKSFLKYLSMYIRMLITNLQLSFLPNDLHSCRMYVVRKCSTHLIYEGSANSFRKWLLFNGYD